MDLEPGERVIFEGHPAARSILALYVKGLGLVVLAGAIAAGVTRVASDAVGWGWVAIAVVVVLVGVLLVGHLRRLATTYTITTSRLVIRRGILSRAEQHSSVDRIQNVTTRQTVLERLLRVGAVEFDTAAGDDDELRFVGVADPHGVIEAVRRAQQHAAPVESRTG
jgi:uncharacterized membrane protein YdbT with pleckstrin-like domain